MPRPKQADRDAVAETNITFRASRRTRAKLDALVSRAKERAVAHGGTATMGSYLTALIDREAAAEGIEAVEMAGGPKAAPAKPPAGKPRR